MKKLWLLAVVSGVAVFSGTAFLSGCSGAEGTGGGGGGSGGGSVGGGSGTGGGTGTGGGSATKTLCTQDSDCPTNFSCHPTSKSCVPACNTSAECPVSTEGCGISMGSAGQVCKCASTSDCPSGQICASLDGVCTNKCTADTQCPTGRTCDTASGDCIMSQAMTCNGQGQCTGSDVCNFTTGHCEAALTCNSNNAQPDTCSYGQACFSSNTCAEINTAASASCGNLTMDASFSWDPATQNGPVIYNITDDATDDAAFCTSGTYAHTVHVYAYWTQPWPAQAANAPTFTYVNSAGSETNAKNSSRPSGYVASGTLVDWKVTLCAMSGSALTAGFYFSQGNGFCITTNGGTLMP